MMLRLPPSFIPILGLECWGFGSIMIEGEGQTLSNMAPVDVGHFGYMIEGISEAVVMDNEEKCNPCFKKKNEFKDLDHAHRQRDVKRFSMYKTNAWNSSVEFDTAP